MSTCSLLSRFFNTFYFWFVASLLVHEWRESLLVMVGHITIISKNQVIEKQANGRIYVYEGFTYYNPRIKNTCYHYRYIGKKKGGETKKVRSILPRRILLHGPLIPLMGIVNAIGI